MAEKVKIDSGQTKIGSKIVDIHQKNEYTRVNNYKEGMCFSCFGNGIPVGRETILVPIKEIVYGMCHFCGEYKHGMEQINARLCQKCHRKVSNIMKSYNKKGGMFEVDPFWKSMRRKHGKDWQHVLGKNLGNSR